MISKCTTGWPITPLLLSFVDTERDGSRDFRERRLGLSVFAEFHQRHAVEVDRRIAQHPVDVDAGLVHAAERGACPEREVGGSAHFLVDRDESAELGAR